MKKTIISVILLSVVLLAAAWQPVLASPEADSAAAEAKLPKLTIQNKTGETFSITLTGPKTYYLSLSKNKSVHEVEQGKYTYSYYACGATQTGTVNVKKNGAKLKLSCPKNKDKNAKTPKLTIQNKTGESFYITLTGPKTYSFYLSNNKFSQEVEKGKYTYSYYACGGQQTGTVNVKNNGGKLTLKCGGKSKEKSNKIAKVTINNQTGGTLRLTLTAVDGSGSYTYYFNSGKTKIEVPAGKYNYTVWGCGGSSVSGTKNLKGAKVWTWKCK